MQISGTRLLSPVTETSPTCIKGLNKTEVTMENILGNFKEQGLFLENIIKV